MTQLTFGYSDSEDRLWLRFSNDPAQLWLSRRLARSLIIHLIEQMTLSCPGDPACGASADPKHRLGLEHEMSREVVQETGRGARVPSPDMAPASASFLLTSFKLNVTSQQVIIECIAPGYGRGLALMRNEAHTVLAALVSRCLSAEWDFKDLPAWLTSQQAL